MTTKKNGRARGAQPAKPSRRITEKVESVVAADRGMTIREEFAMAAMQGLLPLLNPNQDEQSFAASIKEVAADAVAAADALLAALAQEAQP